MLDRNKVINWWVGRISDQDLADWTGMAPRAVGIVLNLPPLRSGVDGGGRGSRHTRRLKAPTRNAVSIVQALSEAGLTFELAANILGAVSVLASSPTKVIDYSDLSRGVRSLAIEDPKGNWLPSDVVPWHVWERFVLPCYDVSIARPGAGDVMPVDPEAFQPNTDRGTMLIDRSPIGLPPVEIRPLSPQPIYEGEIDPIGFYLYENHQANAAPQFDEHLLIVNGKWIFEKSPDPSPLEAMQRLHAGEFKKDRGLDFAVTPIAVIRDDRKTVDVIGWGRNEQEQKRATYHLRNYDSLLDVNITLAVRKMKRRALGLPVGKPQKPLSWTERLKVALGLAPPLARIATERPEPASHDDDFFREWGRAQNGHRVRVGLTREENDEFEAIGRRDMISRTDQTAFPWASVEEMSREKDRWLELHDKHEAARFRRMAEELKARDSKS
ncbi:MAG: hypothetical protein AB7P12_08105 [Alphaproteobacteria bacterium]